MKQTKMKNPKMCFKSCILRYIVKVIVSLFFIKIRAIYDFLYTCFFLRCMCFSVCMYLCVCVCVSRVCVYVCVCVCARA